MQAHTVNTYRRKETAHTHTPKHTHSQIHNVQNDPGDEAVFKHLPAVMGVIMRTWHLLDIKKHITLSGLSAVYLLTAIWMILSKCLHVTD